uniref:Uncharacterized protein n=1 Tax=Lepeophtheirus salmonis TaxID=72036 RepID=A0A0K2V701_LEPSM
MKNCPYRSPKGLARVNGKHFIQFVLGSHYGGLL